MEEIYLVLGCFGQSDDGFINCRACENRILYISSQLENYNEILNYFDNCKLFDKPIFDTNAIKNIIKTMQEKYDQVKKRLWHEKQYRKFEKFIQVHRDCGLYLKLELVVNKEIIENQIVEEKEIVISNEVQEPEHQSKINIRGRR